MGLACETRELYEKREREGERVGGRVDVKGRGERRERGPKRGEREGARMLEAIGKLDCCCQINFFIHKLIYDWKIYDLIYR